MSDVTEHLDRWRAAGLIDAEAAERIATFERGQPAPAPDSAPSVVEGIVYLGLAAIGVGMVVLATVNWEDLGGAARIAVVAGPAALTLLLGWLLLHSPRPELVRGGSVAWLLAAALITLGAVVSGEEAGWAGGNVALGGGITAILVSAALWSFSRREAQLFAFAAAIILFSFSLAERINRDNDQPVIGGLTLLGLSLAALLLTEVALLTPRPAARALFSATAVFAAFFAGVGSDGSLWAEALSIPLGAGLVILSLRRATLTYMVAGVVAVFIGLATVILRHVDDPTVAALAMILIGVVLVSGVLVLARYRPWRR